jgi:pimeloyl-ACP methyl ester carboxylesterase
MARSTNLGSIKEIELSQGRIRYRESGEGEPVVFLHGLLVNGDLWRKVAPGVAAGHRAIVPDLPLGGHELPMRDDADLTIDGVARLIAEFLAALELTNVTLVANDTGGAITQVLVTRYPDRIGRIVFTSCDAYDNFLPPLFRPLQWLAHVPPILTALLQPLRLRAARRLPLAFGWLAKRPIESHYEDGYVAGFFADSKIRRDVFKVLRDISTRYTLEAARKFHSFHGPVLVAWAAEDRFFPESDGRRLAAEFPGGRFLSIEDSYTFVSEDNPDELVRQLVRFLGESAGEGAGRNPETGRAA